MLIGTAATTVDSCMNISDSRECGPAPGHSHTAYRYRVVYWCRCLNILNKLDDLPIQCYR